MIADFGSDGGAETVDARLRGCGGARVGVGRGVETIAARVRGCGGVETIAALVSMGGATDGGFPTKAADEAETLITIGASTRTFGAADVRSGFAARIGSGEADLAERGSAPSGDAAAGIAHDASGTTIATGVVSNTAALIRMGAAAAAVRGEATPTGGLTLDPPFTDADGPPRTGAA